MHGLESKRATDQALKHAIFGFNSKKKLSKSHTLTIDSATDQSKRQCLFLQQQITSDQKKQPTEHPSQGLSEERKIQYQSKRKMTQLMKYNVDDIKSFKDNFPSFQKRKLSIKLMLKEMKMLNPRFEPMSLSFFYTHFLKKSKYVYRLPKIKYLMKFPKNKESARISNCFLVMSIYENNKTLFFYDETTISSRMCFKKSWFADSELSHVFMKPPDKFLKLNLITTVNRIISFGLTFESTDSNYVADFVIASSLFIRKENSLNHPFYLLLDNGPKNRSERIMKFVNTNIVRLVYTTPTTPQQNFAECIFGVIKRKLSELPRDMSAIQEHNSETHLLSSVFQVLASITQENMRAARHSYYHEIASLLF